MSIDTPRFSETLRAKSIDVAGKRLLLTNFARAGEGATADAINCGGYGRIRKFRRTTAPGWPSNPLPIDPAANKLGITFEDMMEAQVFQNASCNWRCWYCYVPFSLLNASAERAGWVDATELIDFYEATPGRPRIIDLSGGQPDLTPEWVVWVMEELHTRRLSDRVYLWSDDNLSNDYFWRYLSAKDISALARYTNYGKVCCFKGFSRQSFSFNTMAEPSLFENQFELFSRYLTLGLDLYAYVTLTSPSEVGIEKDISRFVDRLQSVASYLPLRVVPLEVRLFDAVHGRVHAEHERALDVQWVAVRCWLKELEHRFSAEDRAIPIYEIPLY